MAGLTLVSSEDTLQTSRLILRGAQESDLDDFHDIFSNEDVMRYWSTAPHTTTTQTLKYLQQMIASPTNGVLDFVLVLSSPNSSDQTNNENKGKVIGKAGIWTTNPTPEMGFMLNRFFWGE